MFQFDPRLHQLPAAPASIAFLAQSSNQPNLAVPGHQAQAAQAWIVALRTSAETCSIFVFLWLMTERASAIYAPPQQHLPLARLEGLVEEAEIFCESMGFIVDRIPFESLSPDERVALLDRLPPFRGQEAHQAEAESPPPAPAHLQAHVQAKPPASSPTPEQLVRIGKLLASF